MNVPRSYNHTGLTRRHLEVLTAVGREGSNAAAARRLHLSEQTVKNELGAIYAALGVHSIAAAIWITFVPDTEA